jgi:subtilisin-like proprotein convertase family protein
VATINSTGLVTALAAGSTALSASQSNISGMATLTVISNTVSVTNTVVLANSSSIRIAAYGAASPYPLTINAANLNGTVTKATVTLNNFYHTSPRDVNILLVSPAGQQILLMANVGSYYSVTNVTLTLDDKATAKLPKSSTLRSGTYLPSSYGLGQPFARPAPAGPYVTNLSVLNGTAPNGAWSLYMFDDRKQNGGGIAAGWSLALTTRSVAPASLVPSVTQVTKASLAAEVSSTQIPRNDSTASPLWIQSLAVLPEGQVKLILHGQPGQAFTLESSTDFISWQILHQGVAPSSQFIYVDPSATASPRGYYRIAPAAEASQR